MKSVIDGDSVVQTPRNELLPKGRKPCVAKRMRIIETVFGQFIAIENAESVRKMFHEALRIPKPCPNAPTSFQL